MWKGKRASLSISSLRPDSWRNVLSSPRIVLNRVARLYWDILHGRWQSCYFLISENSSPKEVSTSSSSSSYSTTTSSSSGESKTRRRKLAEVKLAAAKARLEAAEAEAELLRIEEEDLEMDSVYDIKTSKRRKLLLRKSPNGAMQSRPQLVQSGKFH